MLALNAGPRCFSYALHAEAPRRNTAHHLPFRCTSKLPLSAYESWGCDYAISAKNTTSMKGVINTCRECVQSKDGMVNLAPRSLPILLNPDTATRAGGNRDSREAPTCIWIDMNYPPSYFLLFGEFIARLLLLRPNLDFFSAGFKICPWITIEILSVSPTIHQRR